MALGEFEIELDNPSGIYFPGEIVSGEVILRTNIEVKTKGLLLIFEGDVITSFRASDLGSGGYWKYDGRENMFSYQIFLLGDGDDYLTIPRREEFAYPFSFNLPPRHLPFSFDGDHGRVQYTLTAKLSRYLRPDDIKVREIQVTPKVDLNYFPDLSQPKSWRVSKRFGLLCCVSGPLTIVGMLDKQGFVPGETIKLAVEIQNESGRDVVDITARLLQESMFHAEGHTVQSLKCLHNISYSDLLLYEGHKESFRFDLVIPPVPPTNLGGCKIITLKYLCEVKATIFGNKICGKLDNLRIPITIGTVPLEP